MGRVDGIRNAGAAGTAAAEAPRLETTGAPFVGPVAVACVFRISAADVRRVGSSVVAVRRVRSAGRGVLASVAVRRVASGTGMEAGEELSGRVRRVACAS